MLNAPNNPTVARNQFWRETPVKPKPEPHDPDEVKEAFDTLKAAMVADEPGVPGSYAHSWHCNIAMACYDAIHEDRSRQYSINHGGGHEVDYNAAHRIGNKAATRFMKQCFGVNTKA